MLAKDHRHRPKTAKLWSSFRNIVPEWCRDCDPRHEDVWRPTAAQEAAANDGLDERRSLALSLNELDRYHKCHKDSCLSDEYEIELFVNSLTPVERGQSNEYAANITRNR